MKLTFKKAERLKSRKILDNIFRQGKHISTASMRLLYIIEKEAAATEDHTTTGAEQAINAESQVNIVEDGGAISTKQPKRDPAVHRSLQPPNGTIKIATGVGKKHFKRAVHRNRIKRLLRESYRLQKEPLHAMMVNKPFSISIFFMFTGKEMPTFIEVKDKVNQLLTQLLKRLASLE